MSLNLNVAYFCGRLVADPELRTTQSGLSVSQFTVAINRPKDKDGNSATDFINVVAWRDRADFVTKYFRKGQAICCIGPMHSRSYEDKNGNKRTVLECIADKIDFVESKNSTVSAPSSPAPTASTAQNMPSEVVDDDDLPF